MTKQTSVVLTSRSQENLERFIDEILKQGNEINNGKTSISSVINFIINDFSDVFLDVMRLSDLRYLEAKKRILTAVNGKKMLTPTDRKLNQLIETNQEILYLLMGTNQTLARANPDNYKEISSMYKDGTKEQLIHQYLNTLTKNDVRRNILLAKSKAQKHQ